MEKLNSLELKDLGIDGEEDPYFFRPDKDYLERNYPNISATHIVENENYAVLMFFLKISLTKSYFCGLFQTKLNLLNL